MLQNAAREILDAAGGDPIRARKLLDIARRFSSLVSSVAPNMAPFDFQADVMDDWQSRLLHWTKPRQVGASFTMAGKAVSKACSVPGSRSLFLSLSLDDAREKIEYSQEFLGALGSVAGVPQIETASVSKLTLSNGSRIQAVYYPRGKARADLYLDEFAHHPNARKVYRAALPILVLGGRMTMASTVFSPGTLFSDIRHGAGGKFKSYRRIETRWWDCPLHCNDVVAARDPENGATSMSVEERVARFGTPSLRMLFDSMQAEDFLCEFELEELGEEGAWLPWELILRTTPAADANDHVHPLDVDRLVRLVQSDTSLRAYMGFDVGRIRDTSELSVIVVGRDGRAREEHTATMARTKFDEQEQYLARLLDEMPRSYLAGDETGMGMMLMERLRTRFGARVVGVNFAQTLDIPFKHKQRDGAAKFVLAITLKDAMLNDEVRWQIDASKNLQMHSVRREVTESLNMVFRVDRSAEPGDASHHHADVFWSRALAVWRWKMVEERNAFRIVAL